ncbi:unnamed protein product, partial [Rotaria sp. Silwood1]
MGCSNSKQSLTPSNAGAEASTAAMSRRRRMAENYIVLWVDTNINQSNEDCRNTLAQLRSVVNDVETCKT